jgi:hypothetical protein
MLNEALILFTLQEVAEMFHVSPRTMNEHVRKFPFCRMIGRRKLFTKADIKALYEALPCPSGSSEDPAARTGISTAPSEASAYARAQELLTKSRRSDPGAAEMGNHST